jgi:hypothetical protein
MITENNLATKLSLFLEVETIIPCPVPSCFSSLLVTTEQENTFSCTIKIFCKNCGINASINANKLNGPVNDSLIYQLKNLIYEVYHRDHFKFGTLLTWGAYSNENYKPITHREFRISRKLLNKK